jgi:predicted DNA-binding transcriptional regulator AlpA
MFSDTTANKIDRNTLPIDPLLRLPQVLAIVPVGRSTWWQWVSTGKAPKGIKLGEKTTAWRKSSIQKFVDDLDKEGV